MLFDVVAKKTIILYNYSKTITIKNIFVSLSQQLPQDKKHFKEFYFNNTEITEFEENTFDEIIFETISIE